MPILDSTHDFGHPIEASPDWSESYYFNGYDPEQALGFFARIAIRPNAPSVDGFISLYLPSGDGVRLAASIEGLACDTNVPAVGALRFERIKPMQRWRLVGSGASDEGRKVQVDLFFEALIPPIGVDTSGRRVAAASSASVVNSMGAGHFEQSGRWLGWVAVDGVRRAFRGRGNRDKSWGARRTENDTGMHYWRWFAMNFGDDLHLGGIRVGTGESAMQRGWLYKRGQFLSLRGMEVSTVLAADGLTQREVTLVATDKQGGQHLFTGEVLNVLPLLAKGHEAMTILEGLTRWQHEGATGYGICEYAHHLDAQGRPLVAIS